MQKVSIVNVLATDAPTHPVGKSVALPPPPRPQQLARDLPMLCRRLRPQKPIIFFEVVKLKFRSKIRSQGLLGVLALDCASELKYTKVLSRRAINLSQVAYICSAFLVLHKIGRSNSAAVGRFMAPDKVSSSYNSPVVG